MKRKLWILAAVMILLAVLWYGIATADSSGTCGDKLTWTLTDAGTLTISGTGEMTDYSNFSNIPWYDTRESIHSIVIGGAVTSIGRRAFYDCTGVTSVLIPENVTKIGYLAFKGCSSLSSATIMNDEAEIGDSDHDVFRDCASGFKLRGWSGSTAETYASAAGHTFTALDSGSCGEHLTYAYDRATYTLTISGTGEMTYYAGPSSVPWYEFRNLIGTIAIENGVTSISRYTFDGCTEVWSVTIPVSVTDIGYWAFRNCEKLNGVTVANPDCVIGDDDHDVFDGCNISLTLSGWPGSTAETYAAAAGLNFKSLGSTSGQIGDDVYYTINTASGAVSITGTGPMWDFETNSFSPLRNNTALISVTFGSGVTSIGAYTFYGCTGLTGVTIPGSVISIGGHAFYGCKDLTGIVIPNSVTDIGINAFRYCTSLINVKLPNKLSSVPAGAFYECGCLTSVTIPSGVTSIGNYAFAYCASLTDITIPGSVTSIGAYAFYNSTSLTGITIPDGVTSIGNFAFCNSTSLTGITIPGSVTSIEDGVFLQCTGLREITVAAGNSKYCSENGILFDKNKKTIICYPTGKADTKYSIPSGVTSIGKYAFAYCASLTAITIPGSVTGIGDDAFFSCTGLTGVTIPNSVTSIGDSAFNNCTGLTGVTIPNGVTSIGNSAFRDCKGLTSVTIPGSVTSIGNSAFRDCKGLTSITIPGSVTSIGNHAFYNCISLISVTIPDSVTSIGNHAFYSCSSLTGVTIPGSVTSIGDYAFYSCSSLTSVTISNGVTSIGANAFTRCSSLTSVSIPASVTKIGEYAFNRCTSLASITIHNRECIIGVNSSLEFADCSAALIIHGYMGSTADTYANLNGIPFIAITAEMGTPDFVLPAYLTAIEAEAFSGTMATVVYIPDTVTSLGSKAFANCTSLTQIRIPASITVIPPDLFYGLTSTQIKRITVFSAPGSAAETFANGKGMKFEVE